MSKQNRNSQNKIVSDPVLAGVAGAVIGASLGVAATSIMSNEKTRSKVMGTLSDARDKVIDSMKDSPTLSEIRTPKSLGMKSKNRRTKKQKTP